MKQELSNDDKANVFAMYWEQGARHQDFMGTQGVNDKIYYVMNSVLGDDENEPHYTFDDWKLMLTPISEMIEADAESLYHLYCAEICKYDYTQDFGGIKIAVKHWLENGGYEDINKYSCLTDHARRKGYDVKIYFEANHPATGKTPIELGIAIAKNK